jgi:hypothetical protein
VTDIPPNRPATPDDIEAALQDVRAGLAVPPPDTTPESQPEPPGDSRRRDWLGTAALLLAAAFLGGAAALFLPGLSGLAGTGNEDARRRIGELEKRVGQLATGDAAAAAARTFRDLATRLDGIETRVRALEATSGRAAATVPESEVTGRLAALDAGLADLRTRLATLEQRSAEPTAPLPPPPAPAPAPVPAPDTAALADLRSQIDALGRDLAGLAQRLAGVESALPAPEIVPALDRRISELENADPGRAARNAALALAVSRLAEALGDGRPFAAELAALQSVAPAALDTTAFAAYAQTGLPTLTRFAARLAALAPAIRAAADEDRGGDWIDRLWRGLGGLVTIRSASEPQGDTPEERLDRAERRLAEGDLAAAAGELAWLWGRAREAARDWLVLAEARLAADAAVAALTDTILRELARPLP